MLPFENPENVIILSDPLFQDWGPVGNNLSYNPDIALAIDPFTVEHKIKDVIDTAQGSPFSAFRYFVLPELLGTDIPFVDITPETPIGSAEVKTIIENGTVFEITYTPVDLNLFPVGQYQQRIRFVLQGLNSSEIWTTIETFDYMINLAVGDVLVSPNVLNFYHIKNSALPYIDYAIDGTSWIIRGKHTFILSSETPGVTITEITPSPGITRYNASGSGPAVVRIQLSSFYDAVAVPYEAFTDFSQTINGANSFINLAVYVFETTDFVVTPEVLNFNAVKSINEAEAQQIDVISTEAITVIPSPWMLVESIDTAEADGFFYHQIMVRPIDSINFDAGTYGGFIKIQTTIGFVEFEDTVVVNHTVSDFVSNPHEDEGFTLDPFFYNFSTTTPDTFFEIYGLIKRFKFFSGIEQEVTFLERLPLFQNNGKLNFGEKVHRIMDKFPQPNDEYHQYKPAELSLEILEKRLIDKVEVRSLVADVQKYFAGISDHVTGPVSFLDFNPNPQRVTKNSFTYLNFILTNEDFELCSYKNGVEIQRIGLELSNGWVCSYKVDFALFNQGDIITYKLEKLGETFENAPQKTFYVFPEGKYSNVIVWENEFLVQSVLEATGALSIKSDFATVSNQLYQNLVEIIEVLEVKKTNKFTINTGWLLKNDQASIESLLKAKRVWFLNNNEWVAIVPLTKSMMNEDTERDLIDYTIEFEINRSSNEKNYSL